ncbi:hypothetical protein BaRGS_00009710 [Batillaria attramentaria]|uniref:Uncharacterized protein n=1 Tax=Batillaria attramentaria TaxID=370345 RepID=A0ABD0LIB8_9CAEN
MLRPPGHNLLCSLGRNEALQTHKISYETINLLFPVSRLGKVLEQQAFNFVGEKDLSDTPRKEQKQWAFSTNIKRHAGINGETFSTKNVGCNCGIGISVEQM